MANIVVEAVGTAIADATLKGYLAEGSRVNICLQSEIFKTTWAATNITIADNTLVSPAGTTTADTLTATADNATILQSITSASATRAFSIYLKRKTGTGNIDLTVDNGTTWTTKTITSNWARYEITQAAVTNPIVGVRIATNTDAIYAWGAQLESGDIFASSYIPTVASAVTRGLGLNRHVVSGNLLATVLSGYVEYIPVANTTAYLFGSYVDASNYIDVFYDGTNLTFKKRVSGTNYDAIIAWTPVAGTKYKIAWRFDSTTGLDIFVGGVKGTNNADTTAMPLGTYFYVGADGNATLPAWGNLDKFKIWKIAKSDTYLKAITA
jgi:hypothetical protein